MSDHLTIRLRCDEHMEESLKQYAAFALLNETVENGALYREYVVRPHRSEYRDD